MIHYRPQLVLILFMVTAVWSAEIHDLVRRAEIAQIKTYLETHPDLANTPDDRRCTPLHYSVNRGDLELVRFLLDKGADVTSRDSDGDSPLHWAAIYAKPDIVDLLISRGADMNAANNKGESVLTYALRGRAAKTIVDRLLDSGVVVTLPADGGGALLLDAAAAGSERLVDQLLAKGADRKFINKRGESLLHRVAQGGLKNLVMAELDRGVPVDIRMFNGQTPLALAASAGQIEIAQWLVAKGADFKTTDNFASSILDCAAESGNPLLIAFFLDNGLYVNAIDFWGGSPLSTLVQRSGNRQAFDLLLARGADMNHRDTYGETAFTWAAITGKIELVKACWQKLSAERRQEFGPQALNRAAGQGRIEIVNYLLSQGMHVNSRLWNGQTPLLAATAGGMMETVTVLLAKGGGPELADDFGRTALHSAAVIGRTDIMDTLLARRVPVNIQDNDAHTPLFLARAYQRKQAASFLEARGGVTTNTLPNLLTAKVNRGDAVIWFLGHSSWAIKTAEHFLIFDYVGRGGRGADVPGLSNGNIVAEEIADQNVLVFTSHGHSDHFNPLIYGWKSKLRQVRYFFGWDLETPFDAYKFGEPRAKLELDDVQVYTVYDHHETVPESAFLIKIDGLELFFSGDYLGYYQQDVPYLKTLTKGVDLAFCGCGGKIYTTMVNELAAKYYFPMHAWPFMYEGFAHFRTGVKKATIMPATCAGDRFLYRDGKMTPCFLKQSR